MVNTYLVFQGPTEQNFKGVVRSQNTANALFSLAEDLKRKGFKNVVIEKELNAVYFSAYYARQENDNQATRELHPKWDLEQGISIGGTQYYSLVDARKHDFINSGSV